MNAEIPGPVLVMGAGAVGGWVGGRLAAAGVPVHFVGRPRVLDAWRAHGLTVTDLDGGRAHVAPAQLNLHTQVPTDLSPFASSPRALVLLCVKSGATSTAAHELAAVLPAGTVVLSLQNGVGNARLAGDAAPALTVLPGMVPYNLAEIGPGQLHRGTAGQLAAQDHPALRPWVPVFAEAGVRLKLHADMAPVQWGKLLINLNNPVNALGGLPLRAQLLDGGLRRCFAALMAEGLDVLQAAGIAPAQLAALPPRKLITVLRLPTPIFRLVARRMLRVDAKARSSMADDLALGRTTEIDAICGAILALAQSQGLSAPMNQRISELVRAWPSQPRAWPGRELLAELQRAAAAATA